jgi:hypothetical protein
MSNVKAPHVLAVVQLLAERFCISNNLVGIPTFNLT